MAVLPQELMDKLNKAEASLEDARHADDLHTDAVAELQAATQHEAETAKAALEAHGQANADASDALADLKKYFGITP